MKIALYNKLDKKIIWTIEGNFPDNIIFGILYAGYILLSKSWQSENYYFTISSNFSSIEINTIKDIEDILGLNIIEYNIPIDRIIFIKLIV